MENNHTSLWGHFVNCITRKYCCFKGRARRAEFWGFALFHFIFIGAFNIPSRILSESHGTDLLIALILAIISLVISLALLLPGLGVFVRRMHDIGRSGWNWLWGLLPFVGFIVILVFECMDSQRGTNQYGPCEKYPEA